MVDVKQVEVVADLYEQHRYLDAYQHTQSAWGDRRAAASLDAHGLTLASRLASRLGHDKWAGALLREAEARFPDDPHVWVYVRGRPGHRRTLFDVLRIYQRQPDLDSADDHLRAVWRATAAQFWLHCRDFERAHACAERAVALGGGVWAESTRAYVLLVEDRWAEAVALAERAWATRPGHSFTAQILSTGLTRLGRGEEAWSRLVEAAQALQSSEIATMAIWHTLGRAERLDRGDPQRAQLLALTDTLLERREVLSPLADRSHHQLTAALRCDRADIAGDREALAHHGQRAGSHYYRAVAAHIAQRPDGERRIVQHQPVFQHHETCLPASFVTVASHFGLTFDHAAVAREMTHGGTLTWRLRAFCAAHGLVARGFLVDAASARALLGAGLPFLLFFRGEDMGHAVAAIGIDEAQGTLVLHDPGRERWGRVLLEKLGAQDEPLGPSALVVVPAARAAELDRLALRGVVEEEARSAYLERREGQGRAERTRVVEALKAASPHHPVTRQLEAWDATAAGAAQRALALHQAQVAAHPDCRPARADLLHAIDDLGSTELLVDTLRGIVEEGRSAGFTPGAEWVRAHPRHLAQYADLLRSSSAGHARAEQILRRAIRESSSHATSYHVLADLLWSQGRREEAELAYRLAATASLDDEHYARAYADVVEELGRRDEALAWLRRRAEQLDQGKLATAPWITLAEALRDYGRPTESHQVLDEAIARRPEDGALLAKVARMRASAGRFDEARALLPAIERHATRGERLATLVALADVMGGRAELRATVEQWVAEEPHLGSHRAHAQAVAEDQGADAALAAVRRMVAEHPGHEGYELLLLDYLSSSAHEAERLALLEARVVRSPHDAWAWRELCIQRLTAAERRPPHARGAALAQIDAVLAGVRRTSQNEAALPALEAQRALLVGDRAGAIAALEQAVERDPTYGYALRELIEQCARDPADHARARAAMDAAFARTPGTKVLATLVVTTMARLLGLDAASEQLAAWRRRWPDDVALAVAEGELALLDERGTSAARAVIGTLEPMLARYPDSDGLRRVLARAYARADRTEEHIALLRENIRRAPFDNQARRALAHALGRSGRDDEALAVLAEAVERNPLDPGAWLALAGRQIALGRFADADRALADGAARLPDIMDLREMRLDLYARLGRGEEAIAETTALIARFPSAAYVQLLHARALLRHAALSSRADIEAALARAVELNAALDEGVDAYAVHLVELGDHAEALALLDRFIPSVAEPLTLRGRRAWISAQQGRVDEAIAAMVAVVEAHPHYVWGWSRLVGWLEARAGSQAEQAARLLAVLERAPLADVALGLVRVRLLVLAGRSAAEVEEAWVRLVTEYPGESSAVLWRFDVLWEARRFADARALLDGYLRRTPADAFARARLVQAHVKLQGDREAIRAAVRIWTMPSDEPWPPRFAWDVLEEAQLAEPAAAALLDALEAGEHLDENLVDPLVHHLSAHDRAGLDQLLAWAEARGDDALQARILHAHLDAGRTKVVAAWRDAHPDAEARSHQLWSLVGRLITLTRPNEEALAWWSKWPTKGQVGFYVALIHIDCVRTAGRRRQVSEIAHKAMELLLPDADRGRVLGALFRARIELGEDAAFHEEWKKWGGLPDVTDHAVLACFAAVPEAGDPDAVERIRLRFEALEDAAPDKEALTWARRALKARLQNKRKGWRWIAGWFL